MIDCVHSISHKSHKVYVGDVKVRQRSFLHNVISIRTILGAQKIMMREMNY